MKKDISISAFICMMFASGYLATSAIARQPEIQLASSQAIAQNTNGVTLNSSQDKAKENLTKTLIILGLISGVGALGWYLSRRSRVSGANFAPGVSNDSNKALLDRVSPRLRHKLLRLVNDPKTANRLLAGIHKYNCDRSANWLAEKAIYDLQRGR